MSLKAALRFLVVTIVTSSSSEKIVVNSKKIKLSFKEGKINETIKCIIIW